MTTDQEDKTAEVDKTESWIERTTWDERQLTAKAKTLVGLTPFEKVLVEILRKNESDDDDSSKSIQSNLDQEWIVVRSRFSRDLGGHGDNGVEQYRTSTLYHVPTQLNLCYFEETEILYCNGADNPPPSGASLALIDRRLEGNVTTLKELNVDSSWTWLDIFRHHELRLPSSRDFPLPFTTWRQQRLDEAFATTNLILPLQRLVKFYLYADSIVRCNPVDIADIRQGKQHITLSGSFLLVVLIEFQHNLNE